MEKQIAPSNSNAQGFCYVGQILVFSGYLVFQTWLFFAETLHQCKLANSTDSPPTSCQQMPLMNFIGAGRTGKINALLANLEYY